MAAEAVDHHALSLPALLDRAMTNHPRILEFEARAAQLAARYEEDYGFFDPRVFALAGVNEQGSSVPGMSELGRVHADAFEAQAGVAMALRPGFYLTLGMIERWRHDIAGAGSRHENLLGAGVRVPLLQDRGFALWDRQRRQRLAEWHAAQNELLAAQQRLRHTVEQSYFSLLESVTLFAIAQAATARLEELLEQTKQLVEYQSIAEYQIYTARMEVALSRTAGLDAEQAVQVWLIRLEELTGGDAIGVPVFDRESWMNQVAELELSAWDEAEDLAYRPSGGYQQVLNQLLQAELSRQAAEEQLRGDLSLQAAATWQTTDEGSAGGRSGGDHRLGGHVILRYEKPLGSRAEKSRIRQHESRRQALAARLRSVQLQLYRDYHEGAARFGFAIARFQESRRAVDSARRSLTAESERFRLGESRSRDVLDAQTGVTQAEQRQVRAAADVWRAWSDCAYAGGYGAGEYMEPASNGL